MGTSGSGDQNSSAYAPVATTGRWLCLLLAVLPLAACQAQDPNDPLADGVQHGLGIHGYNYTDQPIESFSVDGTWGGGVRVSTPTAGGGNTTCCVPVPNPRLLPQTYTVRWIAQMCRERVRGDGQWITQYRSGWREKQVPYTGPLPARPLAFEVHFYPNDEIRIEITDDIVTPPRVILPVDERGFRPGAPDWPECTPEQLRAFTE
ncbi:DUF3304 domain-containing protein [Luteimonas yindakuii]|uniref:DUF3304 domain-containing protein n=1 Tax=Luteimonas yindakuii TaxID=2565782 RepID=A0A4Z1RE93_9GAMM|nr:DUF3304 domain-containing protein [Luteimonas yindakuii]TKS52987.1 DUF3304 domain-containing protein [Luteimonas yindakuii]